jgi:hypothetical protein
VKFVIGTGYTSAYHRPKAGDARPDAISTVKGLLASQTMVSKAPGRLAYLRAGASRWSAASGPKAIELAGDR